MARRANGSATAASLLCEFVLAEPRRGAGRAGVPTGPNIQEHRGGIAPVRTYQDLLTSAHDEALFDYYATSQLAFVDAASGQRTPVGTPAVFETAAPSPDGQFILVRRVRRPYSWLVPYTNFPATVEVWDRKGAAVKQIARAAGCRHRAERRRAARAAQLPVAAARAGDGGVGGGARQRRPEEQGAASRQGDDDERAVHGRAVRDGTHRISRTATSRGPTPARCC